jgi:adenosine deaminase
MRNVLPTPSPGTRDKEFYRALPKVELHRHLEGSLRLATMLEIAQQYHLDVPLHDPPALRQLVQVLPGEPYTYQNFLSKFLTLRKFYRSPEIIQRVTREAVYDAAADNIRYLELRFTPVALGIMEKFPLTDVMDWVIEAAQEAEQKCGVVTRLIAGVNRHESIELAEKVTRFAIDRRADGIVGLDLAGDEANFSARPFAPLFREARQGGLRITVHAGEWGPARNVVEAIETLGAERIGHGVRVFEDERAVALARERGVLFEVCPTSNVQSGVCPSLEAHPLQPMMAAGLTTTINTDDPGVSAIKLTYEYTDSCEVLGLSLDDLKQNILSAARHAFLNGGANLQLADDISKELEQYQTP